MEKNGNEGVHGAKKSEALNKTIMSRDPEKDSGLGNETSWLSNAHGSREPVSCGEKS